MSTMKPYTWPRALLISCLCCAGCSGVPEHPSANRDGREQLGEAERLTKAYASIVADGDRSITDDEVEEVKTLTRRILWRGEQDVLARMIIESKQGEYASPIWFPYVEMSVAEAWRTRDVPLTMGASDQTVAALKSIARDGGIRRSRVAAAIAISELDPDLAKSVFLREYGAFAVPRHGLEEIPLAVGPYLRTMGLRVPDEIENVREAKVILTMNERQRLNSRQVQAAANAYNSSLRKLLLAGKWAELADLSGDKVMGLLKECLDSAEDSGSAPDNGGVFRSEEDDSAGPSIFR